MLLIEVIICRRSTFAEWACCFVKWCSCTGATRLCSLRRIVVFRRQIFTLFPLFLPERTNCIHQLLFGRIVIVRAVVRFVCRRFMRFPDVTARSGCCEGGGVAVGCCRFAGGDVINIVIVVGSLVRIVSGGRIGAAFGALHNRWHVVVVWVRDEQQGRGGYNIIIE